MTYKVPETLLNLLAEDPEVGRAVRDGRYGELLRIVRNLRDLTLEEAGRRLGYSAATLSRIERGHRPLTVEMLRHLAEAYQIPHGMVGLATHTILPSAPQRLAHARATHGYYADGDSTRLLSAGMVDCPDYVADAIGADRGGKALKREQLAYHGDQPVRLSTTWVPEDIARQAPALLDGEHGELVKVGISGIIQAATGRIAIRGEDVVQACAAWPAAALHLRRKEGTPMLLTRTWWQDGAGVVQWAETVTAQSVRYPYDVPTS